MAFRKFTMAVNKKVEGNNGNEYQEIGKVEVFYPDLAECGITAQVKLDENKQEVTDDEGIVLYDDEKHNYLQYSIISAVKMAARNKLVPSTVELREGAKIATNWEELLAEGGNRGEALKLISEIKKSFAAFVQGLEKKPEVKNAYVTLFGNKQGLSLQSKAIKDKFIATVYDFAKTLDADNLQRYQRYITGLEEICKAADISLD